MPDRRIPAPGDRRIRHKPRTCLVGGVLASRRCPLMSANLMLKLQSMRYTLDAHSGIETLVKMDGARF